MNITKDLVINLINQNIRSAIPIVVEDGFVPEWMCATANLEQQHTNAPKVAVYIPAYCRIHLFVEELKSLIELCNTKKKEVTAEKLVKVLRHTLIHELRHYDQHQWLIAAYGEHALEIFTKFYTAFSYSENPLECDAFATSEIGLKEGKIPELNPVMLNAVALLQQRAA